MAGAGALLAVGVLVQGCDERSAPLAPSVIEEPAAPVPAVASAAVRSVARETTPPERVLVGNTGQGEITENPVFAGGTQDRRLVQEFSTGENDLHFTLTELRLKFRNVEAGDAVIVRVRNDHGTNSGRPGTDHCDLELSGTLNGTGPTYFVPPAGTICTLNDSTDYWIDIRGTAGKVTVVATGTGEDGGSLSDWSITNSFFGSDGADWSTPGTNIITFSGNAIQIRIGGYANVEQVPPVLQEALVGSTGDFVYLGYNEQMDHTAAGLPPASAFEVTADGDDITVGAVEASPGSFGLKIAFRLTDLSRVIREDQTVRVIYTDPTSGDDPAALQDEVGNDAPSFDEVATNNSTVTMTVPPPPTGLTATADGQTQIDLDWTAPNDNGGVAISGYYIEVSTNDGFSFTDLNANTGLTATAYPHTGLLPKSALSYRVSAINTVGTGDPSNVASATTLASTCTDMDIGNRVEVLAWSVTDVGRLSLGPQGTLYGYSGSNGAMSAYDFDGTETYTIDELVVVTGGPDPGLLRFSLTDRLKDVDRARLKLHVCGGADPFALGSTTYSAGHHHYSWTESGLDWSRAGMVAVALSGPPPAIGIGAEHASYGAGLEDVVFDLRRAGDAADTLTVTVEIEQDETWLTDLSYDVAFAAGSDTASLTLPADDFSLDPTGPGDLTAAVDSVAGYETSAATATVEMISTSGPLVTRTLEKASYEVGEDDGSVTIKSILEVAPGFPRVGVDLDFSINTLSGTANDYDDYEGFSNEAVVVSPASFSGTAADGLRAEIEHTLTIVDDDLQEGSEQFRFVQLEDRTSAPVLHGKQPDGTLCASAICQVIASVTINDDELPPPKVTKVEFMNQPSDNVYDLGEIIEVSVTFSEPVTVTGNPLMLLNLPQIGGGSAYATYAASASSDTVLVFRHTLDGTTDDASSVAVPQDGIELNSGTIENADDTDADLSHDAVTGGPGVRTRLVDKIEVTSDPRVAGRYGPGEEIQFTVTFRDHVIVDTGAPPVLNLVTPGLNFDAAYAAGSGTTKLRFDWTVPAFVDDEGTAEVRVSSNVGVSSQGLDAGGGLTDFGGRAVNVLHGDYEGLANVDTSPPELLSAADGATVTGAALVLTYREVDTGTAVDPLDPGSTPAPRDFAVRAAGADVTVDRVAVLKDEGQVRLTLDAPVCRGDPVRLDYTPGTNRIRDLWGNEAAEIDNRAVDNDTPELRVSIADASAAEGGTAVFTVSLTAPSCGGVTVDYATSNGTARAGSDYTAKSGTLTFAAGETQRTIEVPTLSDSADEESETFTVTLSNAQKARIVDGTATGTIIALTVTVEVVPGYETVTEGEPVRYRFVLSDAGGADVEAAHTYTGGSFLLSPLSSDVTGISVRDAPYHWPVALETVDDDEVEADGTHTVRVLPGPGYTVGSPSSATTEILDNDEGDVPAAPARPGVSAASASALDVSWSAPTDNGAPIRRYQLQHREGTSGGWSTDGFGADTHSARLDGLSAATEYQVRVRARNARGWSPWSATGSATTAGNPGVTVSIGKQDDRVYTEGQSITFRVTASRAPSSALRVGLTVTETGDMLAGQPPTGVTIPAGRRQAAFQVATEDDNEDEPRNEVTATIDADPDYEIGRGSVSATVLDNDEDNTERGMPLDLDAEVIPRPGFPTGPGIPRVPAIRVTWSPPSDLPLDRIRAWSINWHKVETCSDPVPATDSDWAGATVDKDNTVSIHHISDGAAHFRVAAFLVGGGVGPYTEPVCADTSDFDRTPPGLQLSSAPMPQPPGGSRPSPTRPRRWWGAS